MTQLIILSNAPKIAHHIEAQGAEIRSRIEALNIEGQVATAETVQFLKKTRAELKKEFDSFEEQRKQIKNLLLNPYEEMNELYKLHIEAPYKEADKALKGKVEVVELKVKEGVRTELEAFFAEICTAEGIDFLTFDNVGYRVNLSDSMKKAREIVQAFVARVVDDLALIKTEADEAEVLVEYKRTLNASQAITSVRTRKAQEKAERERLLFIRTENRKSQLHRLSMVSSALTRSFHSLFDGDNINITLSEIENLPDEDWQKAFARLEALTAGKRSEARGVLKAPTADTSATPKAEEKIFTARFQVRGTHAKLTALAQFLKENGYEYSNI